jgi:hypothetical protein
MIISDGKFHTYCFKEQIDWLFGKAMRCSVQKELMAYIVPLFSDFSCSGPFR